MVEDHAEEKGLARTVGPDHPHTLAVPENQVYPRKNHPVASVVRDTLRWKALRQILDFQDLGAAAPSAEFESHLAPLKGRALDPLHPVDPLQDALSPTRQ